MTKLLTVVLPTNGKRDSLADALNSIAPKYTDVLVIHDTSDPGPVPVELIARAFGFRYVVHNPGFNSLGNEQMKLGYGMTETPYIINMGDDDVFEEDIFPWFNKKLSAQMLTKSIRPMMCRAVLHPAPHRGSQRDAIVLWQNKELVRGRITGQCFVTPNNKSKMGDWVDDFTHMTQTIEAWGDVEWNTKVVQQCY